MLFKLLKRFSNAPTLPSEQKSHFWSIKTALLEFDPLFPPLYQHTPKKTKSYPKCSLKYLCLTAKSGDFTQKPPLVFSRDSKGGSFERSDYSMTRRSGIAKNFQKRRGLSKGLCEWNYQFSSKVIKCLQHFWPLTTSDWKNASFCTFFSEMGAFLYIFKAPWAI